MPEPIDPKRFQKVDMQECNRGDKIRNWHSPKIGEFLSRIWSNYGPPDYVGFEGFSYCFRDTETGLYLSVYSLSSGPAFGGEDKLWIDGNFRLSPDLEARFNAVIDAFERLMANSSLADCEIEFNTDFGLYRVGVRNGIPFEEKVDDEDSSTNSTPHNVF